MKIAHISTYRVSCGVGIYLEQLVNSLSTLCENKVFAETIIPPQVENEPLDKSIKIPYERCWTRNCGYDLLEKKLLEYKPDIAHFQFVSGVYSELAYAPNSPFQQFLAKLRANGISLSFTFHDIPEFFDQATQLKEWYKNLQAKFFVMNPAMLEGIKKWYPEADVSLIPLGTPTLNVLAVKRNDYFTITQVGFYGTDKGMLDIVKAIPDIKIPNFKIVFAGGFHPLASPQHRPYVRECITTAIKLGVADKVVFVNKLLSENEVDEKILQSDLLILNQQMVFGYSTSASAHRILTAYKPIVMSQSPKLSEFKDGETCLKCSGDKIAETINKLYLDKQLCDELAKNAYDYGVSTSFDKIAKRHVEVYLR